MISIIKKGEKFVLSIVEEAKERIDYTMDWEEMGKLFCQVAEQVCKQIGKKEG